MKFLASAIVEKSRGPICQGQGHFAKVEYQTATKLGTALCPITVSLYTKYEKPSITCSHC